MTKCDRIVEMLVDYADGDLPEAERESVEGHLAACSACRAELATLERSLQLAMGIWQASATEFESTTPLTPAASPACKVERARRSAGRLVLRAALAAAAVVIVGVMGVSWLSGRHDSAVREAVHVPERPPQTAADVEEIVARAERAARLEASMEILASQPGMEPYYAEAKRYYDRTYGRKTTPHAARPQVN